MPKWGEEEIDPSASLGMTDGGSLQLAARGSQLVARSLRLGAGRWTGWTGWTEWTDGCGAWCACLFSRITHHGRSGEWRVASGEWRSGWNRGARGGRGVEGGAQDWPQEGTHMGVPLRGWTLRAWRALRFDSPSSLLTHHASRITFDASQACLRCVSGRRRGGGCGVVRSSPGRRWRWCGRCRIGRRRSGRSCGA